MYRLCSAENLIRGPQIAGGWVASEERAWGEVSGGQEMECD